MGITGLIPFLEKSSKQTNISEFSGKTVAVDTYCWLHKGAFSCADKLVMGLETDAYVKYCMKFVQMLLSNKIKPILVFDGRHLPAKAETEVKRREARDNNRKRAAEFIKMGKISEGKNLLRRSLDVSHKMALEVIKECQAHNVDCIVAPYEADAQLAYLNLCGIADVVITEDSDLTLFGCKKIFFKMDLAGYGVLVEQDRLHLSMGLRRDEFSMDKFIYMCILSGCDYLASLPGIGLQKACKFIVKTTDTNIYNALTRMASTLNKKTLVVTKDYRDNFMRALVTFKHQLVFCPIQRKQVRLNPPTPDVTAEQLVHAGSEIDAHLAWQLALGNCDPFTYEKLHDFDPDKHLPVKKNAWSEIPIAKHVSMWSKDYKAKTDQNKNPTLSPKKVKPLLAIRTISARGQIATMKTDSLKREITPKKRTREESEAAVDEIVQLYKRQDVEPVETKESTPPKSPILTRRSNPFKKLDDSTEKSPNILYRARKRFSIKSRFKPTVIDYSDIKQSRFFAGDDEPKVAETPASEEEEKVGRDDVAESMEVNFDSEDYRENIDSIVNGSENKILVTKEVAETPSKEEEEKSDQVDVTESMEVNFDSEDYRENIDSIVNGSENKILVTKEVAETPSKEEEEKSDQVDVTESMEVNFDSEDYRENIDSIVNEKKILVNPEIKENVECTVRENEKKIVIIPETELFDDDETFYVPNKEEDGDNKDSGYKEFSYDSSNQNKAVEPFRLIDGNMVKQNTIESHDKLNSKESKVCHRSDVKDDEQFSITREIFSEYKSSLFTHETTDKRPKRDSLSRSSPDTSLSVQRFASKRVVKTNTKKNTIIQGQRSLLNMFGFQKKNSFQH
ncbi:exonuclease 1 [Copidosoma floridanum]|uniref:exonuclease 1 n=1 Tax=Copidosoma floridanum TaxID=29053 RepID=UPI0006C99AB7|nr:exonuclease 1 [Copidosoma floridanum]